MHMSRVKKECPVQVVDVIGGMSVPGRITMLSDRFVAVAQWAQVNGEELVTSHVKALPAQPIVGPALTKRPIPMPQVVRLYLFLFFVSPWVIRILLILGLVGWLSQLIMPTDPAVLELMTESAFFDQLSLTLSLFLYIWFFSLLLRVRRWHGAEHMAIETYRKTGSIDLADIAQASPVSSHCGGRLVIPFILASVLSSIVSTVSGFDSTLVLLVSLEALLWIDKLIGFHRVPLFAQVAMLMQRLTTGRPNERELHTAHKAITTLVQAHASTPQTS